MGMVLGAVASALYIVDAHRKSSRITLIANVLTFEGDIAVEAFTCLLIFKNLFSFGLTWGAYHWLVEGGIHKVFLVIASVQVGICLLSIPMCKIPQKSCMSLQFSLVLTASADILGKKNRAFFSRHHILKMTHLW